MSKAVDKDSNQLETLSNAEIRAKCIQHGLPNVPVTDSSRNVLIKKLRVSMGGGAASAPKKTNRRETIHIVPSKPPVTATAAYVEEQVQPNRPPSRPTNRRTIAATPSVSKEQLPVVAAEVATSTLLPVGTGIPAPIGNRRRSTLRESSSATALPTSQVAAPLVAAKVNRPLIIIESDDEDEVDLILAAERAEHVNYTQERRNKPPSRAASLSKTSVQVTSYQQPSPPLQEEVDIEIDRQLAGDADTISSSTLIHNARTSKLPAAVAVEPLLQRKTFIPPPSSISSRYTLDSAAATHRYSSTKEAAAAYYSPTLRRNAAIGSSSITTSSQQYSQPRISAAASAYYNEQSDDTDTGAGDEQISTPFLSNFARSLERIKAEPLVGGVGGIRPGALFGSDPDLVQRHNKRPPKVYEGGARQPINQQQEESLAESLGQLFAALERKFHLKRNLALFFLILLVVFLFVIFWQ